MANSQSAAHHALFALGSEIQTFLESKLDLLYTNVQNFTDDECDDIANAIKSTNYFKEGIEESKIVEILQVLIEAKTGHSQEAKFWRSKPFTKLIQLIKNNKDNIDGFFECAKTIPPKRYEIIRLLKRGGQKVVFIAKEAYSDSEVVLKRFNHDYYDRVKNELQSQKINHTNIHTSFYRENENLIGFFIEDIIEVLNNERMGGILEPINLMYDLANGIKQLHNLKIAHLDIKPENIGINETDYVLIDFGVCRKFNEIKDNSIETGTLRTRAPELLIENFEYPDKADIWAIGATVYNAIYGRFPLFMPNEEYPNSVAKKNELKLELKRRVSEEYDSLLTFEDLTSPLSEILKKCLEKKPSKRFSAEQLTKELDERLGHFLRQPGKSLVLLPNEELHQIDKVINLDTNLLDSLPYHDRNRIFKKLQFIYKALKESGQDDQIDEFRKLFNTFSVIDED